MNAWPPIHHLVLLYMLFVSLSALATDTQDSPAYSVLPASILRTGALLAPEDVKLRTNWRGLVCATQGCELRPINLGFQAYPAQNQIQVHYSPTTKKKVKVKGEFTIALIGGTAITGKNQVPTWFTLRTPRSPDDIVNGSLGVTIRTPEQGEYHLIPRWNQKAKSLTLYMENRSQRQRIGQIKLEVLNSGIETRDLLIWAGDMDGDGKIDLITRVSNTSDAGGLHLWLSSLAAEGEMVGIAASLDYWTDVDEAEGC